MCLLKKQIIKICHACKLSFVLIDQKRCLFCGNPANIQACPQCIQFKRTTKHVAIYQYNDAMKDYFKAYKLFGGYHLKDVFIDDINRTYRKLGNPLIVPIPVTNDAFKERGFNQIEALLGNNKIERLLICKENKKIHQKDLNRQERLNMTQPFKLNTEITLPDKKTKICLFDDIYTTGQTISHAVKLLETQGFKNIMTFSLAR